MYYAQISNGVVSSVVETAGQLPDSTNLVQIDALDQSLLGCAYADGVFTPTPPEPPKRHITVGRFFDRFGAQKYPVLASSNPMVQALIKDCSVRSYIDLDDPQLPAGLQMLVDAEHAVDVQAILTAPITPVDQA